MGDCSEEKISNTKCQCKTGTDGRDYFDLGVRKGFSEGFPSELRPK